jgi:hypothetical protein
VNPITLNAVTLARRVGRERGALPKAAGAVSGTPWCDPESFICYFGQSGRSPRRTGSIWSEPVTRSHLLFFFFFFYFLTAMESVTLRPEPVTLPHRLFIPFFFLPNCFGKRYTAAQSVTRSHYSSFFYFLTVMGSVTSRLVRCPRLGMFCFRH